MLAIRCYNSAKLGIIWVRGVKERLVKGVLRLIETLKESFVQFLRPGHATACK